MHALREPLLVTDRQREVIELIAQGLSNDELSHELGISPRTAKAHCDVLRQKLGVPRRRQIPLAYRLLTGEDPLATAQRELEEETGYVAAEWSRLGVIHNAIGYSDEGIELYLAQGLEKRAAKLDAGEFLEVFDASWEEAIAMVRDGRITDAKTIAALLWPRP